MIGPILESDWDRTTVGVGVEAEAVEAVTDKALSPDPSRVRPYTRVPGILGPPGEAPPDPPRITPPQADNDDHEAPAPTKRGYIRKKRWSADLRTNTTTRTIPWDDYWAGRQAWRTSWEIGLGLDCMVTIRPRAFKHLDPAERYRLTQRWMRHMREFYRANDDVLPEYAYLLSRESTAPEGTGEHVHWLVPTAGRQDVIREYLEAKFPAYQEVVVEVAHRWVNHTKEGKRGNASTYLLKAAEKSVRDQCPDTPFRLSGPVYGPRAFWSTNLNPTRPRYRVPAPKRKKDRPSPERPLEIPAAA